MCRAPSCNNKHISSNFILFFSLARMVPSRKQKYIFKKKTPGVASVLLSIKLQRSSSCFFRGNRIVFFVSFRFFFSVKYVTLFNDTSRVFFQAMFPDSNSLIEERGRENVQWNIQELHFNRVKLCGGGIHKANEFMFMTLNKWRHVYWRHHELCC